MSTPLLQRQISFINKILWRIKTYDKKIMDIIITLFQFRKEYVSYEDPNLNMRNIGYNQLLIILILRIL